MLKQVQHDEEFLTHGLYKHSMRFLFLLLFVATPALGAPHSGLSAPRTAPELSDVALFVMAAAGVWFVRRALRRRFAKARDAAKD